MPQPKVKLKLAEFEQRARDARDAWVQDMLKGSKIEDRVKKMLNDRLESLVYYIIGFENRWGSEWSFSRVNGREPEIYLAVKDRVAAEAQRMVEQALANKPTLAKGQRDAIRKAYVDQLAYQARDLASDRGARDAANVLDDVLNELHENEMPFCPACQVRHLEPLHELEDT